MAVAAMGAVADQACTQTNAILRLAEQIKRIYTLQKINTISVGAA